MPRLRPHKLFLQMHPKQHPISVHILRQLLDNLIRRSLLSHQHLNRLDNRFRSQFFRRIDSWSENYVAYLTYYYFHDTDIVTFITVFYQGLWGMFGYFGHCAVFWGYCCFWGGMFDVGGGKDQYYCYQWPRSFYYAKYCNHCFCHSWHILPRAPMLHP